MVGKKILYFIRKSLPTAEERALAEKVHTRMFRSIEAYSENDTLELCDGVAGLVPEAYLQRYKRVDEAPAPLPPPPEVKPTVVSPPLRPITAAAPNPNNPAPWNR